MKLIVAVDKKWGIGKKNGLLFSIPEDMSFFRKTTLNKVVCMGYNTLLSLPNGPLKNRINVVLAPEGVERDDCIIVHSERELFSALEPFDTNDVFVIGGGMFYRSMYPYCDEAYITKVDADGEATVFFDNLDELDNWSSRVIEGPLSASGYRITFNLYSNSNPKQPLR